MAWTVYDFVSRRGENIVKLWLESLEKQDRIRMTKRLDDLRDHGHELCPNLVGPVGPHIYKIRVNGRQAPRLFLCKGPLSMDTEYTLLWGAFERDGELPEGTIERADENRNEVIASPKTRRCPHERVKN